MSKSVFKMGDKVVSSNYYHAVNNLFSGRVGEVVCVSEVNLPYEKYIVTVAIGIQMHQLYSKGIKKYE